MHQMALHEAYFESIKNREKRVEVRLNDAKRRKIKVGDLIEFISIPNQDDRLTVRVTELRMYSTFKKMYQNSRLKILGVMDGQWTI